MKQALPLLAMAAIALALYLLPAIVAFARKHKEARSVFLANLLAGWTVLGWGVALVGAFEDEGEPQTATPPQAEEAAKHQTGKRAA